MRTHDSYQSHRLFGNATAPASGASRPNRVQFAMLRMFVTAVFAVIFTACGAQVDIGGTSGSPNVGGSASGGGNISTSTGAAGASASNGGSAAIDVTTYCNGLLNTGCNVAQMLVLTGCDTPWQQAPPAGYPWDFAVVLDCMFPPLANLDAGMLDGYYIDYSQSPAHLKLTGSYCTSISTSGAYGMIVRQVCAD